MPLFQRWLTAFLKFPHIAVPVLPKHARHPFHRPSLANAALTLEELEPRLLLSWE